MAEPVTISGDPDCGWQSKRGALGSRNVYVEAESSTDHENKIKAASW
ncbi:MAG: hypothetical protein ABI612_02350 [Betaproteobacteria bacterium]